MVELEPGLDAWRTVVAASVASTCSVLIGSPFDSLKVRLQTASRSPAISSSSSRPSVSSSSSPASSAFSSSSGESWEMTRRVYQREGIRGFFRGILPPLISVNLVKTLSISVYEHFSRSSHVATDLNYFDMSRRWFMAGCLAGVSTSLVSCPMEMIRNQRILNDHRILSSSIHTTGDGVSRSPAQATTWSYLKKVYEIGGVQRGLYRGYSLHLTRESLGTGIYWFVYESVHHLYHIFNSDKSLHSSGNGRREGGMIVHFVAGSMTGIGAWLVVFPVDLIKNQYQKQIFRPPSSSLNTNTKNYLNIWDLVTITYRDSGFKGFYRGIGPCIARAIPIHGVTLLVYEYMLSRLKR